MQAVSRALKHGPQPQPEYLRRIEAAFPLRDGKCCERVADAIRDSTKRIPSAQATLHPEQVPVPAGGTVAPEMNEVATGDSAALAGGRSETEAADSIAESGGPRVYVDE